MEKTLFQNILHVAWTYKKYLIRGFLLILTANLLLILNPFIVRLAIADNNYRHAFTWGALLISVALSSSLLRYQMRVSFVHLSREAERSMRYKMFERIQEQSMEFYDKHGIGELTNRLSSDIASYRDVLGPGIMFPSFFVTMVIPGVIGLFYISPPMAALTLLPVILIPFINIFLRKKIYDAFIGVQEKLSEMNNFVQETYSGIKIVKAYTGEPLTLKKFEVMCEEFFRKNLKLIIWQGFFHPFMILLTRITTILLVMLAGFIILKQYEGLSTGDFIAFMWIQSYIFFPVLILGWVLPIYQQGRGAYDRLKSIYEEPIKVQSEKEEGAIPPKADIVFNHLTFTYPSQSKPALNDINLTIKGGTKIGITGPSGSGKSTLFKLLSREYEIPRGMIEIGNEDIHDYPLEAFYQEIVSVEQIPFLFSKSIKENVIFGNELASKEELEAATKLADLHETVLEFSEGYETMVGERGVTLSGGQKQRVAIARAFLVNRSILLLDDIFASVDSGTEQRIFQGLFANFQDKTILLTSQRASTLEKMDRILFISGGSIIEDGTPEELLKKDGKFSLLKDLQRLDVRA